MTRAWAFLCLIPLAVAPAFAGDADVTNIAIRRGQGALFNLDVTVRSKDTGWERYADRIEAIAPDGPFLAPACLITRTTRNSPSRGICTISAFRQGSPRSWCAFISSQPASVARP